MKAHLTEGFIQSLEFTGQQYDVYDTVERGLILRVNKKEGKAYTVQYARGKRIKIADFGKMPLKLARLKTKEVIADAKKGKFQKETKTYLTYNQYLEEIDYPWMQANIEQAERIYYSIKYYFASKVGHKLLTEITFNDIEEIKINLTKRIKKSTINTQLGRFKASMNRAVEREFILFNPIQKVKHFENADPERVAYLKEDQKEKLFSAFSETPKFIQVMLLIALNTGIRKKAVRTLKWKNIELEGQYPQLTVESKYNKNKKTHHVPLNDTALTALKEWKKISPSSEWVFMNPDTNRPYTDIQYHWQKLREKVNLEHFRWHDLRHDFASGLAAKNIPLDVIGDLLDHSDPKMTKRYRHLQPKTRYDAVSTLNK